MDALLSTDEGLIETPRVMVSCEDASVNFVAPSGDGGFWESRFVQRTPDYFIVYLSSHSGCNKSCRFCHLTATGQTMMQGASIENYLRQSELVLDHYDALIASEGELATTVHFNFMARGEALSNPAFVNGSGRLFDELGYQARERNLNARFMVSTIMPQDFTSDLKHVFADLRSTIYYSLYSTDEMFRRRWLPKAKAPAESIRMLVDYQKSTGGEVVLHWAFIHGENDSVDGLNRALDMVQEAGLKARFNLVRYNPFSPRLGQEPSEEKINALFDIVTSRLGRKSGSRIVPRVGFDVKASCGMFVT